MRRPIRRPAETERRRTATQSPAEEEFARLAVIDEGNAGDPPVPPANVAPPPAPMAQRELAAAEAPPVNPGDENAPSVAVEMARLAAAVEQLAHGQPAEPQQFARGTTGGAGFQAFNPAAIVAALERQGYSRSNGGLQVKLANTYGPGRAGEILQSARESK